MQFNSIEFIFQFLPMFMIVYAYFDRNRKTVPMIVGSLVFYACACAGNEWNVGFLIACVLLTYLAGLTLRKSRPFLLGVYLVLMAAMLCFFKLYNGGRHLPAGMSFYLFQMAAYLIDVNRQRCPAEQNILHFSSQMVMFPKLLSGPIVNPKMLHDQSHSARMSAQLFREGIQDLVLGLGLKVILANRLGGLWSEIQSTGFDGVSVIFAWLGIIGYSMKLYFDFYGYSLMAVGLGKMMGYQLPMNFEDPYASKTVSEFYRRWHVTLGAWFREYLYIPLGGNRKGTMRTVLNLGIVWLFTGLWHGVGGNYLIWALILFLLVLSERFVTGNILKKSHVLCHIYLPFVILLSWVPFAIGDFSDMVAFFGRLFGLTGGAKNPMDYMIWGQSYFGLLGAGAILATPLPGKLWKKIQGSFVADLLTLALFWVVVYYISTAAQDPFMYFQY